MEADPCLGMRMFAAVVDVASIDIALLVLESMEDMD